MPSKVFEKSQIPMPKSQVNSKTPNREKRDHDPLLFEMMVEKIKVNSCASRASASRLSMFAGPVSIDRRNRRLSLASLRQIFARIRKSFLLSASSASIQFAATDPDARTSCRASSVFPTVLGNVLTNARTYWAKRKVRSSRLRGLGEPPSMCFLDI